MISLTSGPGRGPQRSITVYNGFEVRLGLCLSGISEEPAVLFSLCVSWLAFTPIEGTAPVSWLPLPRYTHPYLSRAMSSFLRCNSARIISGMEWNKEKALLPCPDLIHVRRQYECGCITGTMLLVGFSESWKAIIQFNAY